MSLSFKNNMEEMRENHPADNEALETDYKATEKYDTPGNVRNLCFVWPDGRMKFMNYAYLVSGEYLPEQRIVLLCFTTKSFSIVGLNLKNLYNDLLVHSTKYIICQEERYNEGEEKLIVNEIIEQ